jgi:hypothetical protein
LTIPGALAVSAIAVGCPTDDAGEPATETSAATGGQELPDCPSIEDENACPMLEGCIWYPDLALCVVECGIIGDQQTCDAQGFCYWTANEECAFGGI